MKELVFASTISGYGVPLTVFRAPQPNKVASVLILPALGVSAKFYTPLANELAMSGVNAILFEQRGYGDSELRASRTTNYGFKEWLAEDIPAALQWAEENLSDELVLMGHSLGGHLAACYASLHPDQIKNLILPATGSPWIGAYSGKMRSQIRFLSYLIPVFNFVFGYYNGKNLGFGGKEARQMMNDWVTMARHNRYHAEGLDEDLEQAIGNYTGRVLSIRFENDAMAPEKAVRAVNDKFKSAELKEKIITSDALGKRADHFNWVREPSVTTKLILAWLSQHD